MSNLKGFGTYKLKDPKIIFNALRLGYNLCNTAELYRNEDIIIDIITSTGVYIIELTIEIIVNHYLPPLIYCHCRRRRHCRH